MRLRQPTWSILAKGWTVEHPPECVTFRPPDDDAALQISDRRKTTGPIEPQEPHNMARRDSERFGVPVTSAACGDFSGVTVEFIDGDLYWRRWWLANGETLLFVTYNTDASHPDRYRAEIDSVLSTLAVT